jgi:CDP-4-dehydro-6-deoxyglucose reductase, E3
MAFKVTIKPSNHSFTAETGETVLAAALKEGFPLPYGCRDGACGACKGKVLEGRVNYGRHQDSALTEAEKAQGKALFCCAAPESDLVIECKEVSALRDIPVKTLPARVQKMEKLAPDVMALSLKLPANERLQFLAGQYLDILLKDGKRRSFSMANPPHDDEQLEIHVRKFPGGNFSEHVFSAMKERDILRLQGPLGAFFLREDSEKPIVFVASGTGFAPIKAIIEHALYLGLRRPMTLYWGGRRPFDLYLAKLPEQWRQQHDHLRFVPVLSEALASDQWSGRTGLVHQAVLDDHPSLEGFQVYACGVPVMVEAAHRDFTQMRGLPDEEFFSDAFTFSNDTKSAAG